LFDAESSRPATFKVPMNASTADLKFLHRKPRVHHLELQIESVTGIDNLRAPWVFEAR